MLRLPSLRLSLLAGMAVMLVGASAPVRSEDAVEPAAAAQSGSEIERFCSNIADSARDRRYAIQTADLEALRKDIDERMAKLEEKRAEYEGWLKRREDFLAMANNELVEIYSKMRPDAASEKLSELDLTLAAALLMKLDARFAGLILNEMERKKAAALTSLIATSARKVDPS